MEKNLLSKYASKFDRKKFQSLHAEMSFSEYLALLNDKPLLARTAFQYLRDMVLADGVETVEIHRKTYKKYPFFHKGKNRIFGLVETLDALMNFIDGAAGHYGTERRILLMVGPVGSSKSTIVRKLKRGLEEYSIAEEGAWYSYKWINLPSHLFVSETDACPMHEDPIRLMPLEMRNELIADLNEKIAENHPNNYPLVSEGNLCPRCQEFMDALLAQYDGDWAKVVEEHIVVTRLTHSEARRLGIGTFQPKDEKNQDATELTGDLNYQKIGHYGKDSDPRAFNFDGEFCVSNRGIFELIEMLKLHQEFLYDLLGASQEHNVKPKKFSQIDIDEVIFGHTNIPEYEKLQSNQFMEALRDRTVKIDVPYLLKWSDEQAVYNNDYGPGRVKQHIMPHTLEIAAFWAVLTRHLADKESELELRDKVKLYDGRALPGWTDDRVKEMKDKYPNEGMKGGVSARFVQDKISNCLARNKEYVNVFHVLNEIKEGIKNSPAFSKEDKKRYDECVDLAEKELQEILKNEVQRALVADDNLIHRMCAKYVDNMIAYVNDEKVINPLTKKEERPDERLMRAIEEKIDIREQMADDFRRSMAAFIGTQAAKGKKFTWDSNPELKRALEAKLFEDTKDHIKLSTLTVEAAAADPDLQEKIDALKTRLIKQFGYNKQSATDVLDYVSSIFARGTASD